MDAIPLIKSGLKGMQDMERMVASIHVAGVKLRSGLYIARFFPLSFHPMGKTQFVLFGRMQFVLKVCSMHEVIVCSTGFSLFYQKTVG